MSNPQTPTKMTRAEAAANARRALAEKHDLRELGRKGGLATVQKHGKRHMSTIGKRGLEQRINTRWGGDRAAFYRYFVALGQAAQDPFPQNGAFPHPGPEPTPVTPADWNAHFHPVQE